MCCFVSQPDIVKIEAKFALFDNLKNYGRVGKMSECIFKFHLGLSLWYTVLCRVAAV